MWQVQFINILQRQEVPLPPWGHDWCVLCFRLRSTTETEIPGQLFHNYLTDTTQARMSSAETATSMDICPRTVPSLKSAITSIHIQLISLGERNKLMCLMSFWVNRRWCPASFVASKATLPVSAPISTVITVACRVTCMIRVRREHIGTNSVIAAAWLDTFLM